MDTKQLTSTLVGTTACRLAPARPMVAIADPNTVRIGAGLKGLPTAKPAAAIADPSRVRIGAGLKGLPRRT